MGYRAKLLARRAALGRPIRVGLVGAGQMGRGFVEQIHHIEAMEVVAVADVKPGLAEATLRASDTDHVLISDDPDKLSSAIQEGRRVGTEVAGVLPALPVDIVIEASGIPTVGATTAVNCLLAGKDVGLLTVETDITVGLLLNRLAGRSGCIYTVCRGDEPVEAKRLVDYARDLGFTVICAGKGKNNDFDRAGTPDRLESEAIRRGMNPKMLTSFVDGSKTMIEMAALSNATGLRPSRRGMHGPTTTVGELDKVFVTTERGGVLESEGVVDFALGDVAPGVFCTVRTDSTLVRDGMEYLKMGPGPAYSLYRPYHLANLEAPLTVAAAVLDREPDLAPSTWTSEVVATAKRNLEPGEMLDGIGGFTVYGVIDAADDAAQYGGLPLGLTGGARVVKKVAAGTPLTYNDVELDETSLIVTLRKLQDALLAQLTVGDTGDAALATVGLGLAG